MIMLLFGNTLLWQLFFPDKSKYFKFSVDEIVHTNCYTLNGAFIQMIHGVSAYLTSSYMDYAFLVAYYLLTTMLI